MNYIEFSKLMKELPSYASNKISEDKNAENTRFKKFINILKNFNYGMFSLSKHKDY